MSAKRKPVMADIEYVTIPDTKVKLRVFGDGKGPFVPRIDEHYVFRAGLVEEVGYGIVANANVLLVGDSGSGKSSLIEQIAALCKQTLRRVNVHGETDTTKFVGREHPTEEQGVRKLIFRMGFLAEAMLNGYWVCIDEIDSALQPVLFVLQQMLEEDGKLVLDDADSTPLQKHPNFRLFATANTVGIASRHKLLYSGTLGRLNEATLDRFSCVVDVPYMDPAQEELVISKKAEGLDMDFVKAIVRIANEVRHQLQDDQVTCTFSTRRCIDWARAMRYFHPLRAAKITVLNKLGVEDYKVLEGVVQRYFGTP